MRRADMRWGLAAAMMFSVVGSAAFGSEQTTKTPAEAIAIADAARNHGVKGFYEMTVAASEKTDHATFLNSTANYKAADNLTFSLSPAVAVALKARFGSPPEEYLKGKRVTVYGEVRAGKIFDMLGGRIHNIDRIGHSVHLEHVSQIVTVEVP